MKQTLIVAILLSLLCACSKSEKPSMQPGLEPPERPGQENPVDFDITTELADATVRAVCFGGDSWRLGEPGVMVISEGTIRRYINLDTDADLTFSYSGINADSTLETPVLKIRSVEIPLEWARCEHTSGSTLWFHLLDTASRHYLIVSNQGTGQ